MKKKRIIISVVCLIILAFIGFFVYVRNVGLFISLSYLQYKRQFRYHKNTDHTVHPLSMADYINERAKNRKPLKIYFIVGLPFLVVSYLLVISEQQKYKKRGIKEIAPIRRRLPKLWKQNKRIKFISSLYPFARRAL